MTDPEKILVAGDWHGNGQWAQKVIQLAHRAGCDTIMHVGDFGFWGDSRDSVKYLRFVHRNLDEHDMKLYWVDGNHENHSMIKHYGNVYTLDVKVGWAHNHDYIDRIIYRGRGERWDWWGKTWMSLGGAASVDRRLRTEDKSWWREELQTQAQLVHAMRPGNVDVMVTHDCPAGVFIPGVHASEKLDRAQSMWPEEDLYASEVHRAGLAMVVDEKKPSLLFHGHYHVRYEAARAASGTVIIGLAEDGSRADGNWIFLNRNDER